MIDKALILQQSRGNKGGKRPRLQKSVIPASFCQYRRDHRKPWHLESTNSIANRDQLVAVFDIYSRLKSPIVIANSSSVTKLNGTECRGSLNTKTSLLKRIKDLLGPKFVLPAFLQICFVPEMACGHDSRSPDLKQKYPLFMLADANMTEAGTVRPNFKPDSLHLFCHADLKRTAIDPHDNSESQQKAIADFLDFLALSLEKQQ